MTTAKAVIDALYEAVDYSGVLKTMHRWMPTTEIDLFRGLIKAKDSRGLRDLFRAVLDSDPDSMAAFHDSLPVGGTLTGFVEFLVHWTPPTAGPKLGGPNPEVSVSEATSRRGFLKNLAGAAASMAAGRSGLGKLAVDAVAGPATHTTKYWTVFDSFMHGGSLGLSHSFGPISGLKLGVSLGDGAYVDPKAWGSVEIAPNSPLAKYAERGDVSVFDKYIDRAYQLHLSDEHIDDYLAHILKIPTNQYVCGLFDRYLAAVAEKYPTAKNIGKVQKAREIIQQRREEYLKKEERYWDRPDGRSRFDYAGGSEDVQGMDYTAQESISQILGESTADEREAEIAALYGFDPFRQDLTIGWNGVDKEAIIQQVMAEYVKLQNQNYEGPLEADPDRELTSFMYAVTDNFVTAVYADMRARGYAVPLSVEDDLLTQTATWALDWLVQNSDVPVEKARYALRKVYSNS